MREATHHTPSRLQFLPDWRTEQHGEITPGGKLVVEYDTARLPSIRPQQREADTLNVEAYIRFHPSDELRKESLVDEASTSPSGRAAKHSLRPLEIEVPKDATQVEVWFRTYNDAGGEQEAWDSQFGKNYWFDVAARSATSAQREHEATLGRSSESIQQQRHEAGPHERIDATPRHRSEEAAQHKPQEATQQRKPQEAAQQHKPQEATQHRQEAASQHKQEVAHETRQPPSESHPSAQLTNQAASTKRKRGR